MGDETRVQVREVKKGAVAMGGIVERYMIRLLGPLGRKVQAATQAGRAMALAGIAAIVVSVVLIFANALSFRTEIVKGVLVVSKPVANLRAKPSTAGKVIAKAEKGETVSYLSSSDSWYKVRASAGTGWISQDMVERRGKKAVVITYEMKGYGIVFLAGLALFVAGIVQKQNKTRQ
jgi:uncharacterized protein YgiM (DUF1202 family)